MLDFIVNAGAQNLDDLVTKWRADEQDSFEREQLRQAYERGPVLRNDPRLLAPVRCRVLKRFGIGGGIVVERQQRRSLERPLFGGCRCLPAFETMVAGGFHECECGRKRA